jgi:hypothetical protein
LIADLFTRDDARMDRVVLVEERLARRRLRAARLAQRARARAQRGRIRGVGFARDVVGSYTEQAELARIVFSHGAAVKFILCGTNAAGNVENLARLRRTGNAVVVLDANGWLVKGCFHSPPQQGGQKSEPLSVGGREARQ